MFLERLQGLYLWRVSEGGTHLLMRDLGTSFETRRTLQLGELCETESRNLRQLSVILALGLEG